MLARYTRRYLTILALQGWDLCIFGVALAIACWSEGFPLTGLLSLYSCFILLERLSLAFDHDPHLAHRVTSGAALRFAPSVHKESRGTGCGKRRHPGYRAGSGSCPAVRPHLCQPASDRRDLGGCHPAHGCVPHADAFLPAMAARPRTQPAIRTDYRIRGTGATPDPEI